MGYIYKITNQLNNKIYIGQTICKPCSRWYHHITDANLGSNLKFHKAIRKYGKENFKQEIIEKVDDCLLNEREIYWIQYYNSYKDGYNSTQGGDNPPRNDIQVICLETGIVYASSVEASKQTGISKCHIAECARNAPRRATAGGYHWMQLKDYQENGPIYRELGNRLTSKSVLCLETGVKYKSVLEASKATGVPRITISNICKGIISGNPKYHWRYNDNK